MATSTTGTSRGTRSTARKSQARRPRTARVAASAPSAPKAEATVTVRTKPASSATQIDARMLAFAWIGASDLAVSTLRGLSDQFVQMSRDPKAVQNLSEGLAADVIKRIGELAARGEKVVAGIQDSAYTKRAMGQTQIAKSQVKAARTSILKAVDTATVAAREAVKKVS
jgi:hypothetical protein